MEYGGAVGGSSLYKGSEEGFDYECDPCKVEEGIREAKHFCPVSQEYLCDDCHRHHRKMRATKSHKILFCEDIPKKPSLSLTVQPQDVCACGQNVADYYCEAHKEVFCVTCKTVRHRSCKVEALDDVVQRKTNIPQFNATLDSLKELLVQATETETLQGVLLESLTSNEKNCEESIRTFRRAINELFDNIEEKTIDELKKRCASQKTTLSDRRAVCRSIKDKLDVDYKASTEIRNGKGPRDIFIQNLRLSQTLALYRDAINDAKSETILKEISFEKDSILVDMQLHAKQLGFFSEEISIEVSHNSFLNAKVEKVNEFSLETRASGMCLINGNVILTDQTSPTVTLLDSKFNILDTLKLKEYPRNITDISNRAVICSLPYHKQIQYIEVYQKINLKNRIDLKKCCFGLQYFDGHIFACCVDANGTEVQVLTKDGIIQRVLCLKNSKSEEIPMASVNCLGLSKDGCRLYISEFQRRTLTYKIQR